MTARKKVVLFIVEGVTDRTCLARGMKRLISNNQIEFRITNGDITSKRGTTTQNVKNKVVDHINAHAKRYGFQKSDFLCVIHLMDTDGAYIDDSRVVEDQDASSPIYLSGEIKTADPEGVIARNRQKRMNMNVLFSANKIWGDISYRCYYLSCNLDHVLHNNANLSGDDKDVKSDEFNDKYGGDPKGFLQFFRDPAIALPGTYAETWEELKNANASLARASNIHLLFENDGLFPLKDIV